jgi:hypothetical protein
VPTLELCLLLLEFKALTWIKSAHNLMRLISRTSERLLKMRNYSMFLEILLQAQLKEIFMSKRQFYFNYLEVLRKILTPALI